MLVKRWFATLLFIDLFVCVFDLLCFAFVDFDSLLFCNDVCWMILSTCSCFVLLFA